MNRLDEVTVTHDEVVEGIRQAVYSQLESQKFGYWEDRLPHIMYRAFRDAMKDWLNEHPEYMKTVQRIET